MALTNENKPTPPQKATQAPLLSFLMTAGCAVRYQKLVCTSQAQAKEKLGFSPIATDCDKSNF